MPSFVITRLDAGPDEFSAVLPVRARVIRAMPGSDRADYVLCYVERPIPFRPPAGFDLARVHPEAITRDARGELISVQGIVICTRLLGETFRSGMKDLAVNIAYVIDNSLTREPSVDFGKLEFAAIGFIDDSPTEVPLPGEARP
ncbi:MAG TPA: hypothetical protein VFQ74_10005 [Pseudolysinimonas sp.]|nr:hypothetical protein [Pseudolysinimonas sp.]